MKFNKTAAFSLLAVAIAAPGLAAANSEWHSQPGVGTVFVPAHAKSTTTATEVTQELNNFRANPVSADGQYRYVNSEIGWELKQHSYKLENGKLVHADKLSHNTAAPDAKISNEEAAARRALYTPG